MSSERTSLDRSRPAESELYEDLLNRYERVLVFAGRLQEKLREQRRLAEKNVDLEEEKARLEKLVMADQAYIRLLENALKALDVFPDSDSSPRRNSGSESSDEE